MQIANELWGELRNDKKKLAKRGPNNKIRLCCFCGHCAQKYTALPNREVTTID